jgi:D-arabinose 5-phosphate isomerase GutQ
MNHRRAEESSRLVPAVEAMALPSTSELLKEESSLREASLRLALLTVELTSKVALLSDIHVNSRFKANKKMRVCTRKIA